MFGVPYAKIGREAVAQECVVDVMPESKVPRVKVCFRRLRALAIDRVAVVHTAEAKPSKLFDQHAVVPPRMRPVPDRVAIEIPHEQRVAAGKEWSVPVHDLMGHANVPQLAIQLMRPKGNDVEAINRKGKMPGQVGISVF